jgi:hypothetical protein
MKKLKHMNNARINEEEEEEEEKRINGTKHL